jgi:hypothetical protein
MVRTVVVLVVLGLASPIRAVVLSTREQRNTRAPIGVIADSGWQWQGEWGNFAGTVISKNTFITAGHVGGNVGEYFTYGGRRYQTIAMYDDPLSDLRIWSIRARLTSAAPLQVQKNEGGKGVMIYGRGTQRGEEVVVNGQLKGWLWGQDDHVLSWGKNVINGASSGLADDGVTKVDGVKLFWNFDRNGVSHEGGLSLGDSGGAVFMKSPDNVWRLAGVNYAAQYLFTVPPSAEDMRGAIVDAGGLKFGDTFVDDVAQDIPTRMYATRISARIGWITDVLAGRVVPNSSGISGVAAQGVPEPGVGMGVLGFAILCLRRRSRQ